MKHLRLLGMESEREALLKAMQDMECVEISSIDGSEEALKSGFAKPDDKALMSAQEASRAYRTALASLDRFAPEKKGMFRKRQGVSRAAFFSAESEENARTAAETINKDTRRLGEIESERTKNEALRATLAPWLTVDAPLGGADGALAVFFGTVGLNVTDDALKALADSLDGLLTWQQASSDRSLRYLLVMCHGSVKERALSALRDLGFSTVSFRGMTGTAKENDKALAENLAALEKERQEIEQRIAGLGGKREALLEASDRAAIALRREEAKSRLVGTDKVFLLEGWLPADRCAEIEKTLKPFTCAIETREPTEDEYPQVPVQLKNNKLTRPLNMVTEMYSLPAYGTLDPNPLMAPFFILFYGIMMADMGYGLLMMIASVIISKKYRPKGTSGELFSLLGLCGISTFIMGALTGGFRRFPHAARRHRQPRHGLRAAEALRPARRSDDDPDRLDGAGHGADRHRHGHQFDRKVQAEKVPRRLFRGDHVVDRVYRHRAFGARQGCGGAVCRMRAGAARPHRAGQRLGQAHGRVRLTL